MNYRRGSTKVLPSLQQSIKNNPQNTERPSNNKNFKQIQQKLSLHQNEITRNQKTIVTLTSQFRLLKQELTKEQSMNQDNEKVYEATMQQNAKLLKRNKQLKVVMGSLEVALRDRQKQLQTERQHWRRQQSSDQQSRINEMKTVINCKVSQNESLNKTIAQLKRETGKLKQQLSELKRVSDSTSHQEIQQQVRALESALQKKDGKIQQCQKEIHRLREDQRKYINIAKQHSKCDYQYNQVKKTNQMLLQTRKDNENRIVQLQSICQTQENKGRQLDEQIQKRLQKLTLQLTETQHKLERQRRSNQSLVKTVQNHKTQAQKLKHLQTKMTSFTDSKENLRKSTAKLKQTIVCEFCKKIFNQPVTNIPCGHSYCLECKKGYQKQCKKCTSTTGMSVKRQAVYRNELMDEVLQAYQVLTHILKIFEA